MDVPTDGDRGVDLLNVALFYQDLSRQETQVLDLELRYDLSLFELFDLLVQFGHLIQYLKAKSQQKLPFNSIVSSMIEVQQKMQKRTKMGRNPGMLQNKQQQEDVEIPKGQYQKPDFFKKPLSRSENIAISMVKQLQNRGESFYKFGFRSFEKYHKLRKLEGLLELDNNRTKGSMHLVDLWYEDSYNKYLKSNQMFLNKKKLLKEIRILEVQSHPKLLSSTLPVRNHSATQSPMLRVTKRQPSCQSFQNRMSQIRGSLDKLSLQKTTPSEFGQLDDLIKHYSRIQKRIM